MITLRRPIWIALIAGLGLVASLLVAHPTFAAAPLDTIAEGSAFQQALGLGSGDLRITIASIIRGFLGLLGVLAVCLFVYAGFLWMTSGGNEERTEKARQVMINAVIGLMIILMSYIITSFVLTKLLQATGASISSSSSSSGLPGGHTGGDPDAFSIETVQPQGTQTIKNITVRLTFTDKVDEATVADNITVTDALGRAVDVQMDVSRDRVDLQSAVVCTEDATQYCFDENTTYTVHIGSGLTRASDGEAISCGGLYDSCTYEFTSGDLVDVSDPDVVVTYPEDGDSVSVNDWVTLQAQATDDAGVSLVEFLVDGEVVDSDQPEGDTPTDFTAEVLWDTSNLTVGETYDVTATAYDVNDHEVTSDTVTVTMRAAHCFNGDLDEDETGEDCGGADCGSCGGSSCTENSDCQSGVCEGDVCVDVPEITGMSPGNGAVGTYVTISGSNFGSTTGTVKIGDVEAELASCDDPWDTNQIVAVVPESLAADARYAIAVTTSDGYSDTTEDDNGTLIDGFAVNTTERPGICDLSPAEGEVGAAVTVRGINFGKTQAGGAVYVGEKEVSSYRDWSSTALDVTVPTLVEDAYSTTVWIDGIESNEVEFTVQDPDADSVPTIGSVEPDNGPIGQYVTITGSGFGSSVGVVYFTNTDSTSVNYGKSIAADVDFPAACEEDYWSRDQIVVKVPEDAEATTYVLSVKRQDGTESEYVSFVVTAGTAGPGVCLVEPDAAPVGYAGVTIDGEGFGDEQGSGAVYFYNGSDSSADATITSWSDEEIVVSVPSDAASGPLVVKEDGGDTSNKTTFEVGDCNEVALCDTSTQQCCSSGACVADGGSCPEDTSTEASYAWVFSTGNIPVVPQVVVDCSDETISPTPWNGSDGGSEACINAAISATFDIAMDPDTFTTSSIGLEKCTDQDCGSTTSVALGSILKTAYSFTVSPEDVLEPSTTYQVVLNSTITSAEPTSTAIEKTTWQFNTRASTELCDIADVQVTPSSETITERGESAAFNAQAVSDDACVILNSDDYQWLWSTDETLGKLDDSVDAACAGSPSACQTITGIQEGDSYALAEEVTQGVDDSAELIINFTDPYAQDYWPNCSGSAGACVNAQIGVQFNTEMDAATLHDLGAVMLYRCTDETCRDHVDASGESMTVEFPYGDDATRLIIDHDNFEPSTYYEVVLSGDIASQSGVDLHAYYDGDFRWQFLTKADSTPCAIDRVEMDPATVTLDYVGATAAFDAQPYGAPNDCTTSGERLTATDYDWTWDVRNESIATLWNGGRVDVTSTQIPNGCTDTCVAAGTESYGAICGEDADGDGDLIDPGEDCDDGNAEDGDGCSSSCLAEGSGVCADASSLNCCGNGIREDDADGGGEECDDDNTDDGDGCSSRCTNEGSRNLDLTCGDGVVTHIDTGTPAGGEDCDTAIDEYCSSNCLNEGSTATSVIVGICGNGVVEAPAEECDGGAGCSDSCLYEGSDSCESATDAGCCGNGDLESSAYETCDDGNTDDGDGCSSSCLLEGSSTDYAQPSWCGDAEVGFGESESCEITASELDGSIEPEQVAVIASTAPGEVVNGLATTDVSAQTSGETGIAELNLSCSCTTDSQCSDATAYGCGASGCCFARPEVSLYTPTQENACRNALLSLRFSQPMEAASLDDNITVIMDLEDGEVCPYDDATAYIPHSWIGRVWKAITSFVHGLVRPLFAADSACVMPVTFSLADDGEGQRVSLVYTELLEADHTYTVRVEGDADYSGQGVQSANGVGMSADYTFTADIGSDICMFDTVQVDDLDDDSPGYFSDPDESHDYHASALSTIGGVEQELQPIPDVYDWDWKSTWWSTDTDVLSVDYSKDVEGDDAVVKVAGTNGDATVYASATITTDTYFDPSTVGDSVSGATEAIANICENPWPAVPTSGSWTPFEDSSTANTDPDADGTVEIRPGRSYMNFSTYYCRDSGTSGTSDDLPKTDVVNVARSPSGVLKEYLMEIGDTDAIGIRIVANENLLPINEWYTEQGFVGSPTETTVDGFAALQDGRTTYISAPNRNGRGPIYPNVYVVSYNQGASSETVEIYDQVIANFSLLANFSNDQLCYDDSGEPALDDNGDEMTCTSDFDCASGDSCHADKDKLTRDLTRLTDLNTLQSALEAYGEEHGRCSASTSTSCTNATQCPAGESCEPQYPDLAAGSYLRSMSASNWDSWDAVLADALDTTIPTDPLNEYTQCGTTGPYSSYAAETCWNSATSQFVCPIGSHVYQYRNVGGGAYALKADLEYGDYNNVTGYWADALDADITDDNTMVVGSAFIHLPIYGYQIAPTCDGTAYGASSTCGDGVISDSEDCEAGQTDSTNCTAAVCESADPDYDGQACYVDCDDTTICSGGDANDDGICDSGLAARQACGTGTVDCTDTATCSGYSRVGGTQTTTCNNTCDGYERATEAACVPDRCGNGVIDGRCSVTSTQYCSSDTDCPESESCESTEDCDDGTHNGDYGYCGSECTWDTAFYCGDGTLAGGEVCDNGEENGVYTDDPADSCNSTCSGTGPSCGDGTVNGSETCDGDTDSWVGSLCSDGVTECTSDDDCASGDTCGDEYLACPVANLCVGGDYDGFPCDNFVWTDEAMNATTDIELFGKEIYYGSLCSSGGGTCASTGATYQTYRTRSCNDSGSGADCGWNAWTDCNAASQYCGDGEIQGDEVCDDGNDSNNDECTNDCQLNVCGDGYLYEGEETCDEGDDNGTLCSSVYGSTCRYCTSSCSYLTASGSFCGDGVLDSATEYCDGNQFSTYYYFDEDTRTVNGTCATVGEEDGTGFTCRSVGVCNGGDYGGQYCTTSNIYLALSGTDQAACGIGGDCITPTCGGDCSNACPFNDSQEDVTITSEEAGSTALDTLSLAVYGSGDSPDEATLNIPACLLATGLTADIVEEDRVFPNVDIMFVLDRSQSMDDPAESGGTTTRLEVLREAVSEAIEELFDTYNGGVGATLRIGFATIGGKHGTAGGDGIYSRADGEFADMVQLSPTDNEAELLTSITTSLANTERDEDGDPVTGTPIYESIHDAVDALEDSTADDKYIVIFTDGNVYNTDYSALEGEMTFTDTSGDGTISETEYAAQYMEEVTNEVLEAKRVGIEVFSAIFSSTSCDINQMAHWSSMSCSDYGSSCTGAQAEGNVSCVAPTNGITYAYSATDSDGLKEMYSSIVDAILNITVTITDEDGNQTTGTVAAGDAVDLPLPSEFSCDPTTNKQANIRLNFNGSGTVELSNIQANICAP